MPGFRRGTRLGGVAASRPGRGTLGTWRNPLKKLDSGKEIKEMKEVSRFHEHSRKALAHPKAVLKITILGVEGGRRGKPPVAAFDAFRRRKPHRGRA